MGLNPVPTAREGGACIGNDFPDTKARATRGTVRARHVSLIVRKTRIRREAWLGSLDLTNPFSRLQVLGTLTT